MANVLQAQFDLEMDEAKQALYDSQQECARYQATMVQMKTHYEQTIKIMKNDKSSAIKVSLFTSTFYASQRLILTVLVATN